MSEFEFEFELELKSESGFKLKALALGTVEFNQKDSFESAKAGKESSRELYKVVVHRVVSNIMRRLASQAKEASHSLREFQVGMCGRSRY